MQTIRVLLVDDEQDLLESSKIYLENIEKNFHIYTATCANDALDLLEKEPIDVIISDYQMAEINGLAFLERIHELGYDIPFIIFTGRGREEVVIQALNLGADYYLQKGGDVQSHFHELINLINKSIDKKKAEIALRKSEEKFFKAFQYSFNSIAINRRSDTEFLDVNDNFLQMLNYSRDEVIGKTSYELMLWAKKENYEHYKKQVLETGEVNDFETILLIKDAR
ncbi:MAG: response regulator [Candidatus Heimdallarchaeota archaeon]